MVDADEYENLGLSGVARVKTFYLAKPDDLTEYTEIVDKIANGLYYQVDRARDWDEESKGYRIYLEWLELSYSSTPDQRWKPIDELVASKTSVVKAYRRLAGLRPPSDAGW